MAVSGSPDQDPPQQSDFQPEARARSLRLGDTILLYAQERNSYVFSDISSNVVQSVAVCPVVPPFKHLDPNLPDTHGACFRVLAANKHDAQLKHKKLKWKLKKKQTLSTEETEQLNAAEKNLQTEKAKNEEMQKRVRGNTLAYGVEIQLQHVYTGKYLCVNSSHTSSTLESTNLRMELSSENSQNCIFMVLPRYKVGSVGGEVRMNDQVIFESVGESSKGQFLHCSTYLLERTGQHLHRKYHELNVSATGSAFTIVPHFCPKEDAEKDVLTPDSVVRLFHWEMECYLVSGGSFANMEDTEADVKVLLRKRRTDRGRLKAPSTSAITYWRIEKQREPLSGEALHWRELCRIQHLPTRQYLAVVKNQDSYKATLKERSAGTEFEEDDTTFRLFPVIEGDDDVNFGSYARIYHVHTKLWLHAGKRENSTPKAEGSQWDGGEYFSISASQQKDNHDAFCLMIVSPDLVSKFDFVAGMVPILQAYIAERKQPGRKLKQEHLQATVMVQVLNKLADFMSNPCARCKDHQKLLRNLKVLELIISCLQLYHGRQESSVNSHTKEVCRAGYKVIEVFLQGNSRKNELYLSGFLPVFEAQMRMADLCAVIQNVLVELVRDNLKIVSTFSVTRLNEIIAFVSKGEENFRFFDYLGVLCVCEGKALVSRQERILSNMVCQHHQTLFIQTIVLQDTGQHGNPKRVFFLDREAGPTLLTEIKPYSERWSWLESQLDLFAKLAKGNNSKAIKTITQDLNLVTFDEALAGARDCELCPSIRLKYVELLIVLFVDVGEDSPFLESMGHSLVVSELQTSTLQEERQNNALSLTGKKSEYAEELWEWLLQVIKDNQKLKCSEEKIMENHLLAEILGVLELLMKFGYYCSNSGFRRIVSHLMDMLEGAEKPVRSDLSDTCFKASPAERAVFAVEHRIMKIFDRIFSYRVYLRLKTFVCEFQALKDEPYSSGKSTHSRWGPKARAVSINIDEAPVVGLRILLQEDWQKKQQSTGDCTPSQQSTGDCTPSQQSVGKVLATITRSHLRGILEPTAFFEDIGEQLVEKLLDIASYNDDNLVVWSVHLLNRFFSSESEVFEKAKDTQLLVTEASVESLKTINNLVATFRKITQLELNVSLLDQLGQKLEDLRSLCVVDELLREPNSQNQKILFSCGFLSDVLNLIFHHLKESSFVETSYGHETVEKLRQAKVETSQKAYQFLAYFVRGHRVVQELLFEQMDALLGAQYAVQDMALVISEVFTNCHDLCIELHESQVEQVFSLITKSKPPEQAALLQALKSMTVTRVNDGELQVKRNQDWVKKYFSNSRKFFNPVLGQDKHDRETRFRIVTCEDDPRLLVMLSVVDLLAACSKGRNVLVQSFCQNILPCDELLELLCNDNVVMSRKLPFCLYLVWVYLDADLEDTHSPNTSDLFGEQWLKYMWKSHGVVDTLVSKLPCIQPTKEVLRSSWYSHFGAQKTHGRRSVLEAVGCLDPGVLEYVLNGIVPLCGIYGKQSMPMLSQEETQEALEKLLRALAKALLKLTVIVQPFLGSPEEAIDLRFALLTLRSSPHVDHYLDVSPAERGKSKQFIKEAADTKSRAVMAFAEEQKWKSQFNRFVSNYEAVCNGPNTLKHQLGVKNKDIKDKEYSEAPCRLPLGPGFQKFVACFVRKDKSGYQVLKHTAILIRQLDVSFTKLTSLAETGQSRQDALDIKCFQVLRAIIHNEIVRIDTELKENQPKKYRRLAATFIEAQNAVQEFGGNTAAKVIPMLNHPNDQVGTEVLAFLSVFMHDGNAHVQKGCEFLCDTKEGQFLSSIKETLVQAVAISRERRALQAQWLMRESEDKRLQSTMDEEEEQNPLIGSTDEFDGSEMEDADPMIIYNPAYQHSTDKPVEIERDSAEALPDHDPTHVQLTLQMLGLMCDGQNHTLQNFLRHQPESISNVNLIHEVAMFAPRYCSSIDKNNVKLVVQVLQTLVEVCVGNFYNQNVVFACQIVDFLNQIVQASSFPGCDHISTHMLELKASAVELLEVMLEDTHVDTPKLARNVLKSLDIDAVHDTLALFHEMQSAEGIQGERKDDDAQRAMFKTFHVVKHLCDFDFEDVQSKELVPSEPVKGDKEHPRRQKIWEAWKDCSVHSKSVEVLYENLDGAKVLSKVHFRFDPDDELSEDLVERVKWRVNRKSAEDKVQDFVKWMKAVSGIVHHKNTLKRRWYAQVFLYNHHIWHWAYIFLTIVLNILVLVAWKDPADVTPETERQYTSYSLGLNNASNNTGFGLPTIPAVQLWFGNYFLLSLGGLHIIMSLQVVFTYFLVNWPNFYFKPNFFYTIRNKKRNGSYVDIPFFGMKTFYYLMLLSWSVLSLVFWGYFYPLCLVHIIVNNDTLQKVLRSVTKNWRSLCWVGALELVILYIYGVVSYAAYQNYFDDPRAGSHCRTLFQCVVSVVRLGMLSGGGLITNADIAPFRDESLIFLFPAYIPRTILDVSFFVIVTTVGLGIFFGIIIDTFSQLEKEKYKAEDDAKDFCFICNLPAHEFNRKAAGFAHHVACEHNMWDYIYFSLELDRTDTSDQNAIQLFVYNQIQEGSHRFFPVLKARCFKHDNDETSIRLARMEEKMQMLLNYFAIEEKSKHEILARQKSQKELIDSAK